MRNRSPWLLVGASVFVLLGLGVALIAVSDAGDVHRDVGVALTSGGVLGLVFVTAESVLVRHGELERLLLQLSVSQDLTGVVLRGRKLDNLSLVGKAMAVADISEARLRRAKFVGADLRWSTLRASHLSDTVLANANLEDVDLSEASLIRVSLRKASLRRSDLSRTRLSLVDLRGTDLTEAILQHTIFDRVSHDATTKWPMGFEAPVADQQALEAQAGQPDWDDYWSAHRTAS